MSDAPSPLEVRITSDGSHTLFHKGSGETYHSMFGAAGESKWVFLNTGYHALPDDLKEVNLLEVGFGTGLNAFLTLLETFRDHRTIRYIAIEPFPVPSTLCESLNYPETLGVPEHSDLFGKLHAGPWNEPCRITPQFSLVRMKKTFDEVTLNAGHYDLCYFDAFSPAAQPGLWTEEVFLKLSAAMRSGGIFSTYCCKGDVRRALQKAGFGVEKLPGPPGKREILRGIKY